MKLTGERQKNCQLLPRSGVLEAWLFWTPNRMLRLHTLTRLLLTHRDQPLQRVGHTLAPRPCAECVLEQGSSSLDFFGELLGQSACDQKPKHVANHDAPDAPGLFAQSCHPFQSHSRDYRLWDLGPGEGPCNLAQRTPCQIDFDNVNLKKTKTE